MQFLTTNLAGVYRILLEPKSDHRGSLTRTYCEEEFRRAGLPCHWVQCNHTITRTKGAVRGMHFQTDPHPETKLIRCIRGAVHDVVVDVRTDSPTFGQWEAFELSEDTPIQLLVPAGFAHGFQCLTEDCHLFYQISDSYHPELAAGFRWDDPDIAIRWPLKVTHLSEKDRNLPPFGELKT